MLYLAIPAHNEAATIGVLLWRLRTVLAEFPREYEAVVYDDASSDSTSEILESYAKVMPLTVLRGERQVGYAGAVDALVRHVARDTRYPRRDALLLLQGDFTDSPSLVPEFIKRFEGGMDVVVGERGRAVRRKAPAPVKRLLQFEPWLTRFLVRVEGIRDLTSSYRLIRISVLRDLLRSVGDAPICAGDARTANADLLMQIVPLARRVEALAVEPTWEIRLRETRVVAVPDAMTLLRWAWRSRGRRAVPSTAPETSDAPRNSRTPREGRADLRLEGRSDGSADAVVTESGRNTSSRDAAGTRSRKPRAGRNESKAETRNESRGDQRSDARAEARPEQRPDDRSDLKARRELRLTPRTEPSLNDIVDDAELNSEATPRERPPRRKRTRGGRRDRAGSTSDSTPDSGTDELDATSAASIVERAPGARPSELQPLEAIESDGDERPLVREIEFSPSLSDAVSDVELEMDGGGRTRAPRKKRRRRGSRGGRAGAGAAGGEDTSDESSESPERSDDGSSDGQSSRPAAFAHGDSGSDFRGSGSDAKILDAESLTLNINGSGSNRASANDGSRSNRDSANDDSGSDDASADDGAGSDDVSAENAGDTEARVRRRGRRGRRGGSRRSRAPRDEGENSSGGEDFSAPPLPAPAPED